MTKFNFKKAIIFSILAGSFLISSSLLFNPVFGATDLPDPPWVIGDWRWNFDEGDFIYVNVTEITDNNGIIMRDSSIEIYNISSIDWEYNVYGKSVNWSFVNFTRLEYHYLSKQFIAIGDPFHVGAFNYSENSILSGYNSEIIVGDIESNMDFSQYLWFIPINDTSVDVEWANASALPVYSDFGVLDTGSYDAATSSLKFLKSSSGWYYNATYFDNGTISRIYEYLPEEKTGMAGVEITRIIERIFNWDPLEDTLIFAPKRRPDNVYFGFDPTYFYDFYSRGFFENTLEGLFAYDLTNPRAPLVCRLATGYYRSNTTRIEVDLREDVRFHDGTVFNATAVKWNFDRLYNTYTNHYSVFSSIYLVPADPFRGMPEVDLSWVPNGAKVDIINKTTVLDTFKVAFDLNVPFGPILDLFAINPAFMISPSSHADDFDRTILWEDNKLVGTGPFKFGDHSEYLNQTTLLCNQDYWRKSPYVKTLVFSYLVDDDARKQAMIDKKIDVVQGNTDDYQSYPDIETNIGILGFTIYYLPLSMIHINTTIRKAINYAFNYSYVIKEIMNGSASRTRGLIPQGMKFHNASIPSAEMNVTYAREILLNDPYYGSICNSRGLNAISTDLAWKNIAETNPIDEVNFTYVDSNLRHVQHYECFNKSLSNLGIKVIDKGTDGGSWVNAILSKGKSFEAIYCGWAVDYMDASTYSLQFYSNTSDYNTAGVNDTQIEQWIWAAVAANDTTEIQDYYNKIQYRLQNELFSQVFIYQTLSYNIIQNTWTGITTNAYERFYFYGAHKVASSWTPDEDVLPTIKSDTPIGTNVKINDRESDVMLIFEEIDGTGITTVGSSEITPEPLSNYDISGDYFFITSNANFKRRITVAIYYDEKLVDIDEQNLKLMHWDSDSGVWLDNTIEVDTVDNIIYGETTEFSTFVIMESKVKSPLNPYIIINDGASSTSSALVTLTLSAVGDTEMRFINETGGVWGAWTSWETNSTTKQVYLAGSVNNTEYSIYVQYRNATGDTDPVGDSIRYLIAVEIPPTTTNEPPSNTSISINSGALSTNSTLVNITLSAVGATEMCFRNGTTGNWTSWEAYNTTKKLYLAGSTNNTEYTIYVKFQNSDGETTPISDSIRYLITGEDEESGEDEEPGEDESSSAIPGYPAEWVIISLLGGICLIVIFNKSKKINLRN